MAEPWADTGTSTGRLMLAVLGGLADVERDLIRTRTAEGRSRAQKRGQHMGRPPRMTDAQKAEARRRRAQGATLAELARSYDVSKATISRFRLCDIDDATPPRKKHKMLNPLVSPKRFVHEAVLGGQHRDADL
jgi:transposase-like protein